MQPSAKPPRIRGALPIPIGSRLLHSRFRFSALFLVTALAVSSFTLSPAGEERFEVDTRVREAPSAGTTQFRPLATAVAATGRKIRFGAYVPEAPLEGMTEFHRLEQEIDHRLQIVHFYQAWGGGNAPFRADWIEAAAAGNRSVLLSWEPWVPAEEGADPNPNQPAFRLRRIIRGHHDGYIRTWARGFRDYGKRVFLRPMHEMNGTWYPWGGTVNGNTPRRYRRAWRRIHHIFRRVGAHNVRWVWSPLVDDVPSNNRFERYYPGDSYVDVLALDGYNWGTSEPGYGDWRSFRTVFRRAYRRIARIARKPVWIAEVGSATEGGNKVIWKRRMFRRLNNGFMPRVRAVVFFHTDKERDWRTTSPERSSRVMGNWLPRFR